MDTPAWGTEFQQTLLRQACDTDLPGKVPGAFTAQLFGAEDGGQGRGPSPRVRIARVIEQYWKAYQSPASLVIIGELVIREVSRLSEEQKGAVLAEWEAIQAARIPEDTSFAVKEITRWAEQQRLTHGLLQAADALERGGLDAAKEILARAMVSVTEVEQQQEITLIGHARERIALWRSGEDQGIGIPTGFPALDGALSGGPRKGEVFYILAPPKGLKTTFLLNIALGAVKARYGVYLETFEMLGIRMLLRADRNLARASRTELREDPRRLSRAIDGLIAAGAGELFVYQSAPQLANAVENTARRIDKLRRQGQIIDVAVFDYLNIMGSGAAVKEREKRHELAKISREIAWLGKQEGLAIWSAALVKKEAMNKVKISKADISESYEVAAVLDGAVAVCGNAEMRAMNLRALYISAAREEEDEKEVGVYHVDRERMTAFPASDAEILHTQILANPPSA